MKKSKNFRSFMAKMKKTRKKQRGRGKRQKGRGKKQKVRSKGISKMKNIPRNSNLGIYLGRMRT